MKILAITLFISLNLFSGISKKFDVIDGEIVSSGDYASVVRLAIGTKGVCTATLLSTQTLLTAAHCVLGIKLNETTKKPEVYFKKMSIKVDLVKEVLTIPVEEKNILVNPKSYKYDEVKKQFSLDPMADIAIITFKKNLKLRKIKFPKIKISKYPVGLVNEDDFDISMNPDVLYDLEYRKFVVVGYGYKSFLIDREDVNNKRYGTVKLLPLHVLSDHRHTLETLPVDFLNKKKGDKSVQVAPGDSGGPLFDELGNLVGVSSTVSVLAFTTKNAVAKSNFVPLYQNQNVKFFKSLLSNKNVAIKFK